MLCKSAVKIGFLLATRLPSLPPCTKLVHLISDSKDITPLLYYTMHNHFKLIDTTFLISATKTVWYSTRLFTNTR